MAKFSAKKMVLWTILLAAPLLVSGDPQTGLNMVAKAGKGVCWVEKLHKLPPIDDGGVNWGTCDGNMKFEGDQYRSMLKTQEDNIRSQGFNPDDHRKMIDDAVLNNLKDFVRTKLDQLPSAYRNCESYVDNESQEPAKDYSSLLKDSAAGSYAWKGFAHCLLQTMEAQNGADSVSDLRAQWATPKSFHKAIIERENENRARHGVPALKLDPELSARAQRYAEKLARMCKMEHIAKEHPDTKYKDGTTGENLAETGALQGSDADNGVDGANGWYTEINNYPWPQYTGANNRGVIGHFTASVWKSSQLAGYGIAKSPGCDKVLIVARYYPGGNIQSPGMPYYKENILPPQK